MAHGAASNTFTRIGRPFSILDTTTTTPQGPNLLSVLSAAQALHVPIMPITWQRARPEFERGGTSNINQTTINAKVSLAFKYVKKEGHPKIEDGMKRMIREITVLGQPAIRNCPNIVQLEGICWYIREQRIWPALVFEKADYGNLATFCKASIGEHLSMRERLKLCMDVANAVFYMHNHNIIHGDIKPDNVLIFKDVSETYTAKVADLGYSTAHDGGDGMSIKMPTSWPWEPPEFDQSQWMWRPVQAEKWDVFSLSMLWVWILFERSLTHSETLPLEILSWLGEDSATTADLHILYALKMKGKLFSFAKLMLANEPDLDGTGNNDLTEFLSLGLNPNPDQRDARKSRLSERLEFPGDLPRNAELRETQTKALEKYFRIEESIEVLYCCDFRVRQHIAQCLIEPSTTYHHDDVDENFKINLALQKALCYHIGFGVPQDQVRVFEILSGIGRTKSDLDAIILPHMHWATRVVTKDQDKYTLGMTVLQELGLRTIELGPYYIEDKNINEALEQLLKEKRAIENISGNQSPIWLILARSLANLYYSLGQWQEANELTKMCLEKSKEVFGEDHRQTLIFFSDLSTICREEQRWDEAETLENKLRDISANVLGPEDPDTLTSISHLASIYRGQNRWEKAEEQEELLLEMRTRILGEEHPDTISTLSNLALTYDKRGRHTEMEEQWERVIRLSEKVLGQDHPQTLISKNNLGVMYHLHRKYEKAEGYVRDVWKWKEKILGTEQPSTLRTMYNLAGIIRDQGRWVEAENIYWQFIYAQLDGGNNTEAFDALEECIKMWMKEAGCEDEQMIKDGRAFRGYLEARPSFTEQYQRRISN